VGGIVPWLRHPPSRPQTDQEETHPLMTHKRTEEKKKESSSKRSTKRRAEIVDVVKKWCPGFYSPTY